MPKCLPYEPKNANMCGTGGGGWKERGERGRGGVYAGASSEDWHRVPGELQLSAKVTYEPTSLRPPPFVTSSRCVSSLSHAGMFILSCFPFAILFFSFSSPFPNVLPLQIFSHRSIPSLFSVFLAFSLPRYLVPHFLSSSPAILSLFTPSPTLPYPTPTSYALAASTLIMQYSLPLWTQWWILKDPTAQRDST